jgi:hypothetical protein
MKTDLVENFEKLLELFNSIKSEVRRRDKHLYEQWKAGGFLVDDNVVSMYPSLPEVIERLGFEES